MALSEAGAEEDDETIEDTINRLMESHKLLPNASYFAFTATPKNKTLQIFGEAYDDGREGQAPAVPQLHDEAGHPGGFHPRRPAHYTPVESYYRLIKTRRGRSRVRHQAGEEEASPLRREP